MQKRVLVVIPARYASTRFPGKPLAMLGGQTVVGRVWEAMRGLTSVERVVVATDDERIYSHIATLGGTEAAMMTASSHRSGTDRCGEVVRRLMERGERYDVVVNVQGDEPFVESSQVQTLIDCFDDAAVRIATLSTKIATTEELLSPNNVKVVVRANGDALYFSRQPLPYRRDVVEQEWVVAGAYRKHVGIYAFEAQTLLALCELPTGSLEEAERLEQLRWMEHGWNIRVCDTPHANIGIDTPADLAAAEAALKQCQ